MAPCLSPVLYERIKGAAFYAVGEVLDGGADNFVASADCEGLTALLARSHVSSGIRVGKNACMSKAQAWNSQRREVSSKLPDSSSMAFSPEISMGNIANSSNNEHTMHSPCHDPGTPSPSAE